MNFIIAYFKGWWLALRSVKIWVTHYLFLLLLALLTALPFYQLLQSKLGRSLAIQDLLPDFDYTVFQDFLNLPGVRSALSMINSVNLITLLLFVLLMLFLTGGVLHVYRDRSKGLGLRRFFSGGSYYFWRMLRLSLYFGLVHGLLLGLFVEIFRQLTDGGFAAMGSEVGYLELLQVLVPIYLLLASWMFMVQDYAKVILVDRDRLLVFRTFWGSFGFTFRYFFHTFFLYLLNAATFIGLVALFYFGRQQVVADTAPGIGLTLLLGQAFVLGRILTRLLNLASASLLYHGLMDKRREKEATERATEQAQLEAIAAAEQEAAEAKIQAERAAVTALSATASAAAAEAEAQALKTPPQDQEPNTDPSSPTSELPEPPSVPEPPPVQDAPDLPELSDPPPLSDPPAAEEGFATGVENVGLQIPDIPDLATSPEPSAPEPEDDEEEIEIPDINLRKEEEE
ncbi:MAG: hypothetical protein AAFR05_17185 [Bacteroidota bacterium]